jgi:acyl-CoA synthetase (AMP-forming)/AMP-acid ligase II
MSEKNNIEDNLASSIYFVESALLLNPLIYDCAVLIKHTHSSNQLLVAYIVSTLPISPEQIQSQLGHLIPKPLLPKAFISVSSIPLTVDGYVDEAALLKLEVIDSDLIDSVEKHLNSSPIQT